MRRFTSLLSVTLFALGCSGGSGSGTEEPPVDTGSTEDTSGGGDVAAETSADDTGADDAADASDGFVGCKADGDCATSPDGKACDTASGKCRPCTATSDLCGPTEHCEATSCVSGCKSDEGCATSGGDAGADADDAAETGAPGKTKCDVTKHTCEECTKDEHCAPGFLCVGNVCAAGCSTTKPCATGETCCGGACVDTQTNSANCGTCGTACAVTSGVAKCETGACKVASCTGTLADCDSTYSNGCETDTATSTSNCGTCGTVCASGPNSTAECSTGSCSIRCSKGFADCDSVASNGCEITITTDVNNCGACGNACSFANATATCSSGTCALGSCNPGFADCDGNPANGCEVDTRTNAMNCGSCGTACSVTNGTAACVGGSCTVAGCSAGFANCDSLPSTGCEVMTSLDPLNCGTCGHVCSVLNGTAGCAMSACTVASCNAGFKDCNGSATDGCEISTNNDVNNCGACGTKCGAVANGTPGCASGACTVATCTGTFRNCNTSVTDGCETNTANDVNNCGGCAVKCGAIANGTPGCAASVCTVASCSAGFANCDGNPTNGCEINTTNDVNNCGACANKCTIANGIAGCAGSACTVASCTTGFANCDGSASNGCEINTNTNVNNCGTCGKACGAGGSCTAGTCTYLTSCQAIRSADSSAASGKYTIDPDGAGSVAPFDVYCEMIGAEGWTLALKANGAAATFAYSAALWTNTTLLNPTSTDLTLTEAKFNSFNSMPFTQLRLGMREGTTDRYITVAATGTSLQSRFATFGYVATTAGRSEWVKLVSTPRLQPFCNQEGTNNVISTYASVRIGLLANQENDCGSPDSFIGFGAGTVACTGSSAVTVGNVGACGASPSDGSTTTWGFVFVR